MYIPAIYTIARVTEGCGVKLNISMDLDQLEDEDSSCSYNTVHCTSKCPLKGT